MTYVWICEEINSLLISFFLNPSHHSFLALEVTTLTFTQTVSASTQACSTATPAYNISSKHMDEVISSLVSELTVDGRSTSRSKARYTSAPDDRMSCRAMGSVALGFILVVLLFIVAADASAWLRYI